MSLNQLMSYNGECPTLNTDNDTIAMYWMLELWFVSFNYITCTFCRAKAPRVCTFVLISVCVHYYCRWKSCSSTLSALFWGDASYSVCNQCFQPYNIYSSTIWLSTCEFDAQIKVSIEMYKVQEYICVKVKGEVGMAPPSLRNFNNDDHDNNNIYNVLAFCDRYMDDLHLVSYCCIIILT